MNVDDRGRQAAAGLRDRVVEDLADAEMLASLPRTRARRRLAVVAPAAVLTLMVAGLLAAAPGHHQAGAPTGPPPSPPSSTSTPSGYGNGSVFGAGNRYLRYPHGVYAPPLDVGSSPTWSPDGSRVAVLDRGILLTETTTGRTTRLPCPGCREIAWSPDGRTLAATGVDGLPLGLVDAATGTVTLVPLDGVQDVGSVTWSPGSDRLALLVRAPLGLQGAYTVGRDGSSLNRFLEGSTWPLVGTGRPVLVAVRWSPVRDLLAVLSAGASVAPGAPDQALVVRTYRPDGSGAHVLVAGVHCACDHPNLTWAPDGAELAVFARRSRLPRPRDDGDGHTVLVRLVRGSGPLSWQPLPRVP